MIIGIPMETIGSSCVDRVQSPIMLLLQRMFVGVEGIH